MLNIGDVAESADGTEVVVEGFVVEDGGVVVLAETLAESFPPQAGGATVRVDGLDLDELDLQQEGSVRWSDGPITINGTVDQGRVVDAAPG